MRPRPEADDDHQHHREGEDAPPCLGHGCHVSRWSRSVRSCSAVGLKLSASRNACSSPLTRTMSFTCGNWLRSVSWMSVSLIDVLQVRSKQYTVARPAAG